MTCCRHKRSLEPSECSSHGLDIVHTGSCEWWLAADTSAVWSRQSVRLMVSAEPERGAARRPGWRRRRPEVSVHRLEREGREKLRGSAGCQQPDDARSTAVRSRGRHRARREHFHAVLRLLGWPPNWTCWPTYWTSYPLTVHCFCRARRLLHLNTALQCHDPAVAADFSPWQAPSRAAVRLRTNTSFMHLIDIL